MDESFAELSQLLNFRDKEQERVQKREARKKGELSQEEMEMDDWDKEMKVMKNLGSCLLSFLGHVRVVVSLFGPSRPGSHSGAPLYPVIVPFLNNR
jgi:hypothetical protein